MKSPLLWVGFFAQGCNLIVGSPATAPAASETDAVGIPWIGEMGVRESTAQLMAREKQLAQVTHARVLKPRLRVAKQTLLPDPDSTPPARRLPSGPLAGNP